MSNSGVVPYSILCSDPRENLQPSEKEAVAIFLDEIRGYLDEDDWRSHWGQYASEIAGPRTNNAVERFHGELKKTVLTSRYRRTLGDFGSFVKSAPSWMQISQYGRNEALRGIADQGDRRLAAKFFERDFCSVVPRSWRTSHYIDTENNNTQWIFFASERSRLPDGVTSLKDLVFSPRSDEAKKFAESAYTSLDEARELKSKYCIVTYGQTASWETPPPLGPWCTCKIWGSKLVCAHVVCISYIMRCDDSAEAKEQWKYIRTFLSRPPQRRNRGGRIGTHEMPEDVRFGLAGRATSIATRKRARESEAPTMNLLEEDN